MSAAPLVIAHRGDSAHRPENTLASFASALEVGATVMELDVQLTADGHAVVIHDPTLDRTTTGRGDVRRATLAEVRAVSAGYPDRFGPAYAGERVPTLAEVLALLRGRARTLVEIKSESVTDDAGGGIEARVVDEVRRAGAAQEVALISFDQRAVERLQTLAPGITRGRLFGRTTADELISRAREAGCELVMPHKSQISADLADRARAAGLKLATWVVDEVDELKRLAAFELYGVGSNRPGVLLEAIADGLLA
ncbi:MAG TPA: glycerophosphodiester phosphodiesterase family protein [Vicinamibacteria bacterium]|nr:glycerophosphodiester phosphodiesterase family protein [Vicinamibacteria bacterium]